MGSFRRLSIAATVATFAQIAVGGLVRATKSGLGCGDDWPRCAGKLIPALETRAEVIEFSHRLFATLVIVLVGAVAVSALRNLRDRPRMLWPALLALGLVLGQAVLGAVVVWLELQAISVVLHLAIALSLAALLIYLALAAGAVEDGLAPHSDPSLARQARLAAGAVFLLLLVGSYVTGKDAGYVFSDWPLMNGRPIPDLSVELYAIHFLHRVLAAVVGVVVAVVSFRLIRRRRDLPSVARYAHATLGLFGVEIVIGALNVWTRLNSAVVTFHLLAASLVWGALVGAALLADAGVLRRASEVRAVDVRVVLEGRG